MPKYSPVLFCERPRSVQFLVAGVVPAALGAVAGLLLGVTSAGYWAIALIAALGAFASGFEHRDGWDAADRGFFGGLIYGVVLLVAHDLAGTHAKVSLGSFPPLLAVITTVVGALLAGAGGRVGRAQRGDPPGHEPLFRR
jgi:hypothetical protein